MRCLACCNLCSSCFIAAASLAASLAAPLAAAPRASDVFRPLILQRRSQVEQRKKKLEKMERLSNPDEQLDISRIAFSFPDPGKLRKSLLVQLDAASFSYTADRPLLSSITAQVSLPV